MRKLRFRKIRNLPKGTAPSQPRRWAPSLGLATAKAQALTHRTPVSPCVLGSNLAAVSARAAPTPPVLSLGWIPKQPDPRLRLIPPRKHQPPAQPSLLCQSSLEPPNKAEPQNPHMLELKVLWSPHLQTGETEAGGRGRADPESYSVSVGTGFPTRRPSQRLISGSAIPAFRPPPHRLPGEPISTPARDHKLALH